MSIASTFKAFSKHPSIKSVGIYTFSNFFAKGASFLLLFVFTNPLYITPSENGLLSLFSNSMLFLMPFLSMGIVHSTSADYFKLDKKEFKDFFSTGLIMPFAIMLISIGVLFSFKKVLSDLYGFPPIFTCLIPVVTFLIFCNEQLLSMARNNNEPMVYLKANCSKIILELGLSFILVVFFAARWQGRMEGILVAYTLTGIYGLYYFKRKGYLFGKIRLKYIKSELVYALPIIAMQASIFAMTASDKFFLAAFSSDNNEQVGIYSVACVFASVINVLSMAVIQYIFPKVFKMLSSDNVDYSSIRKMFFSYLGIMTIGLAIVLLATPVLFNLCIDQKYHSALSYSYLLCGGYFLWAITYFFYSFLLYHKKKVQLLLLSVSCIVVSLLCNYYFISNHQEFGAAFSVFIVYFIVLAITLYFTRQYWKPMIANKKSIE